MGWVGFCFGVGNEVIDGKAVGERESWGKVETRGGWDAVRAPDSSRGALEVS